jgi:very-short-patch-repair endonuclease
MLNKNKKRKVNRHCNYWEGKHHTEESKKKISESMKKAAREGRTHNIGECRWKCEPSYPEKFMMEVISNELIDKNYIRELSFHKYSFDFAWPHIKKYIEIDGGQHKKERQHKSDIAKDALAKSEGWQGLRIEWDYFFNNTKECIKIIKDFIDFDTDNLQKYLDIYHEKCYEKLKYEKENTGCYIIKDNKRLQYMPSINEAYDIAIKVNKIIDTVDLGKYKWNEQVADIVGISAGSSKRWIKHWCPWLLDKIYIKGTRTKERQIKIQNNKIEKQNLIDDRIKKIKESGIKLSGYGWKRNIAKYLGIDSHDIESWIKKHAPELLK